MKQGLVGNVVRITRWNISYMIKQSIAVYSSSVIAEMTRRLHLLPAGIALLMPVTLLITYLIAVERGDVNPFLPYISIAGTTPPESCFFSMMLNIVAYLFGICVYLRYLYVKKFAKYRHPGGSRLNRRATWVGMCSSLGLNMVANFQVSVSPILHNIGAFLCFFGSMVYFCLQSVVSRRMVENIEAQHLHTLRTRLSFLAFLLFVMTVAAGHAARAKSPDSVRGKLDWVPSDPGFTLHVISTAAEWLMAAVHGALLLTFLPAFSNVAVKGPTIKISGITEVSSPQIHTITTNI